MSQSSHGQRFARQHRTAQRFALCAGLLALFQIPMSQANETLRLSSGSVQTPLLELYTSEGCSSCPPADRYFQSLAQNDGLWKRYVPVAFHVTYWDYLGWRDRFSQAAFDDRQRLLAKRANSGVYTPGVFLQGQEWRQWRRAAAAGKPLQTDQRPLVGVLQANVGCDSSSVAFRADPKAAARATFAEVAWLQSAQQTNVRRGENRGKLLQHDFVVASHRRIPLVQSADAAALQARVAGRCDVDADVHAVAIWVTDDEGRPLQAVGGYLSSRKASGMTGH